MAENNAQTNGGQPPKIKLNGTLAPKTPPQVSPLSPPKKETVHIELSSTTATSKGVTPHNKSDLKETTARIEWNPGMTPMSEEDKQEAAKKSTIRIDTSEVTPIPEEDKQETPKKSTVRVQIDEERSKGDTAKLDAEAIDVSEEAAKKRTARIDLNEVLGDSHDIFKSRTTLLDASKYQGITEAPGKPRTIRIKRPETPPTTMFKKSGPMDEEDSVVTSIAAEPDDSKKSETSRIDLPPEIMEAPPTRRKTIRIKRPEGMTTGKTLFIGRAPSAMEPGAGRAAEPAEAEAGALFSALAVVTVLIGIALITVQSLTLRSFLHF